MAEVQPLTEASYEKIIYAFIELCPNGKYDGDLLEELTKRTSCDKHLIWRALKRYRIEGIKDGEAKSLV